MYDDVFLIDPFGPKAELTDPLASPASPLWGGGGLVMDGFEPPGMGPGDTVPSPLAPDPIISPTGGMGPGPLNDPMTPSPGLGFSDPMPSQGPGGADPILSQPGELEPYGVDPGGDFSFTTSCDAAEAQSLMAPSSIPTPGFGLDGQITYEMPDPPDGVGLVVPEQDSDQTDFDWAEPGWWDSRKRRSHEAPDEPGGVDWSDPEWYKPDEEPIIVPGRGGPSHVDYGPPPKPSSPWKEPRWIEPCGSMPQPDYTRDYARFVGTGTGGPGNYHIRDRLSEYYAKQSIGRTSRRAGSGNAFRKKLPGAVDDRLVIKRALKRFETYCPKCDSRLVRTPQGKYCPHCGLGRKEVLGRTRERAKCPRCGADVKNGFDTSSCSKCGWTGSIYF